MIEREKEVLVADFKQKVAQTGASWDDVIKNDGIEKVDAELKEERVKYTTASSVFTKAF